MNNQNKEKVSNSREEWIDLLRALAMFLVIVGHTYNNKTFYQVINPVKMPLFYFLSGFFLGLNKDFVSFVKGIIYRFVLPWIVFSLFPLYMLQHLIHGDVEEALVYLKNILLGYEVWFIPSFIITQLLCYGIYHALKKKALLVIIASGMCFCLGILLKDVAFFDVWALNTALTGVLFVVLGKFFFIHKKEVIENFISKPLVFIASLAVYCLLVTISMISYPQQTMDFHNVEYYNPLICLVLIATGTICCIFVSRRIKPNMLTRYIAIMGQNTLVVYLLNGAVLAKVIKLYYKLGLGKNGMSLPGSIVITIIVCIICTVVSVVCSRYCPVLVGKKK